MSVAASITSSVMDKESTTVLGDGPPNIEQQKGSNQQKWNNTKISLRSIAIISELVLIGLCAATLGGGSKGFSSAPVIGLAMGFVCLIYDTIELLIMYRQQCKAGIRPPMALGFEIFLVLFGLAMTALMIFFTQETMSYQQAWAYDDGTWTPYPGYVADGQVWYGVSACASAVSFLVAALHIVLFVRCCVELDALRKARKHGYQSTAARDVESGSAEAHPPTYSTYAGSTQAGDESYTEAYDEKVLSNAMPTGTSDLENAKYDIEPKSRGI